MQFKYDRRRLLMLMCVSPLIVRRLVAGTPAVPGQEKQGFLLAGGWILKQGDTG